MQRVLSIRRPVFCRIQNTCPHSMEWDLERGTPGRESRQTGAQARLRCEHSKAGMQLRNNAKKQRPSIFRIFVRKLKLREMETLRARQVGFRMAAL